MAESGLKVQAVMSFHAAGGNVGDTCKISLPKWVQAVGEENPDIYYTDREGTRNRECLSLGCDREPIFSGRTPVDLYKGFIEAFADNFDYLFGEECNFAVSVGGHLIRHSSSLHEGKLLNQCPPASDSLDCM